MSHVLEKDKIPDIGDIYRESLRACEEYEACLTTNIYGDTYLDSEKCKARGFNPIKAVEEEEKRTDLSGKWIERTAKEKGFNTMCQEFFAKILPQFVNKDMKSSGNFDDFDDFSKKENKGKNNIKSSEKIQSIQSIRSSLIEASYLLNCKIKLEDGFHVKVVGIKMTNDVFF